MIIIPPESSDAELQVDVQLVVKVYALRKRDSESTTRAFSPSTIITGSLAGVMCPST